MALISPGVQVTVTDESQYTPTAAGSIAYVLLATAQDKETPSGTTAAGTTLANAEKIITVTSQRDLINMFGSPSFQLDAAGNPINGSEINEYGLLAAYSALGVSNQLYVQRANIDLAQLEGTSIRPTGTPVDGTYWLDLTDTTWGAFSWNSTGFVNEDVSVITDTSNLTSGAGTAPVAAYGTIGSYAVDATSKNNPIWYKGYKNVWTLVGTNSWKQVVPAVTSAIANAANISIGDKMIINGANVNMTGTTMAQANIDINTRGITGITSRLNADGYIEIFADNTATGGNVVVQPGNLIAGSTDVAIKLGLLQGDQVLIGANLTHTYYGPTISFSTYTSVPQWRSSDDAPRPYGSIWFKTSATGSGANWAIKQYSSALDTWTLQSAPMYTSDTAAVQGMDLVGGGAGIEAGSIYVKYDAAGSTTAQFKPYLKNVTGIVKATGTATFSATPSIGDAFTLEVSVPGSTTTDSATITLTGTTATSIVASILSAGLDNITAIVETSGAVSVSHLAGGTMKFTETSGTPIQDIGLDSDSNVQTLASGTYLASPFTALDYTFSTTAPYSNPADGTLWYYNNPLEVDIMINDGTKWNSYRQVSNDARGYNLVATDAEGPILAASQPTTQADGTTPVVAGDLWIDTGDLENYPTIRRYNGSTWDLIDNTDQVSSDGIVFADARWGINDSTDPITDTLPAIADMLTDPNAYIDDDCPDYRLYPRGTLLFNTRRSGYNVKRFDSTYFATASTVPTEISAWVSYSGVDADGVPYFGHKAQRNTVVEAMKSAIAASTALREEQTQFNLICTPGYPELIGDMITLNNDRLQTAFIIGDSPLTLSSDSTTIDNWSKNANLANDNGENGLVSNSEYLAVYYPSGLATNLDGNSVVVPASHMMLRTFIRSDNVSYPWFAPAGVRRGLIDNVSAIGYIDVNDGNLFRSIGVTNGLRDVLYANKVNPLTVLPGVGLVAYGQKTRAAQTSAMDRVNVARLVCYLRTVLEKVARPFIFEPNDTITRNQVSKAFEAVLNDVVAKRGIYDYLVVCDTSNNTPDRIDRNELYIDIAIQPVKAIEFVYIPVRLVNTGAALTV